MKRFLLLLILTLALLVPWMTSAQSVPVNDFFGKYASADGFTSVQLEQRMMQMMSSQATERGDKELARLLEDIRYIRIIALKGGGAEPFVRDAEAAVAADGKFQSITSGTENGQTTKFFIREKNKVSMQSELVMLTYGPKETVVVNICGEFDLRQITRLSSLRPK